MNQKEREKAKELLDKWYAANADKNAAAKVEKDSKNDLKVLLKDEKENFLYAITNEVTLEAGEFTEDDNVIDPRKVLELYPDEFWNLVSIPITNAQNVLGEKGATKCSVTIKKTGFNIKKNKNKAK